MQDSENKTTKRFDYAAYFNPILPLADVLRESPDRFWEPSAADLAQPHEHLLYLGCNVLRTVHLAESLVAVLKAMNADFIVTGGPAHCCGAIHQRAGDTQAGLKIGQKTLSGFARSEPQTVLTYCPTCNKIFDEKLAAGALHFDRPYQHVTQFIADRLATLSFQRPIPRRIAVHTHQCTARAKNDAACTLSILRAIPRLDVVEIPAGEEWDYACTGAVIEKIGTARHQAMTAAFVQSAKDAGCEAIVTVYHSCYRELLGVEREFGLEWLNYIELLAHSLNLGPFPPRYKELALAADPEAAFHELSPRATARGANLVALRRSVDAHFRPSAPAANEGVS